MQPAVPLWKVIADFGRRELQPGPQGPGFFFIGGWEINIPRSPAESTHFPCPKPKREHNQSLISRRNTNNNKTMERHLELRCCHWPHATER